MSIYLTDLARWLKEAGLNVREYQGWQSRARGSGGYSAMPLCVMWHHTASPASWDGQKDADYCAVGDSDAPLANLYIDRTGLVWVLAAGATNTNGKGKSISFSRGTVPQDCMNTRAIGVELGNDGVGEPWPQVQIDAAFKVSNVCNQKCGNLPTDVATHQFYAPDRKIDPATASAVQGPWQPASCTSSGTWSRADLQAECQRRSGSSSGSGGIDGGGTDKPILKDDDIMLRAAKNRDTGSTYVLGDGKTAQTMDGLDSTEVALRVAGGVIDVATKKVVYSWSDVGALPGGDVKKYVGSY